MPKEHRRPKGEGSLKQMPNGSWKMTISIGVGADGKQKRKSVTAKTKALLMDKVAKLRVKAGQMTTENMKPRYFKDVVSQWLEVKEETVSANTYATYKVTDNKILHQLYDYRIDKITPDMIDSLLMSVRAYGDKKPAPSYIEMLKRNLGAIMNYAIERNWLTHSPLKGTIRVSRNKKKVDLIIPTEDELKDILRDAKAYDEYQGNIRKKFLKFYELFLLATASGMRIGELLGLKRADIDTKTNTIFIQTQLTLEGSKQRLKTGTSKRRIFVNPKVLEVILALPEETEYVFNHRGGHRDYSTYSNVISRYFHGYAKVPEGFTMHSFRHYHATTLLSKGIGVKEVSKRLGHSSIKTTLDLYAHWLPELDEKAANVIDASYLTEGAYPEDTTSENMLEMGAKECLSTTITSQT